MHYFFDVPGAICDPDREGVEIATCGDARIKAVQFASEMIRDFPEAVVTGEELRIVVRDLQRGPLFTISVRTADSSPLNVSFWE
ncbi:MAG: hypothetical protein EOO77_17540 [Oxalobacteraceae bacterium]|nr:MAG: hypothetical protein EOO77_17540 [Oxalobacteraceae bacterium]